MNNNYSSENSIILPVSLEKLSEMVRESVRLEYLKRDYEQQKQNRKNTDNEYITRREAAKLLHVSTVTLRKYVRKGKIKAYNFGRRVLFRRSEIEQALTSTPKSREGGRK